jgi:predicted DCC family thiol-disulfide oxidoreductase YuxK
VTPPILLYDGACGFCSAIVQFVLARDRKGTLRFAALDGPVGRAARGRHPQLEGVDSVVWVEQQPDGAQTVAVRSEAALRVARYLGGAWRLAGLARVVPGPIRDRAYGWVARHRHQVPGTRDRCWVPPPHQRGRFLDQ